MLKLDHFASIFRAADKETIAIREREIVKVLIVTDVGYEKSLEIWERWRAFFFQTVTVRVLHGEESLDISTITEKLDEADCDLIVSYRCLHSENWRYPHAIGSYVEVITQLTSKPVLLMPHIREDTKDYAPPESIVLLSNDLTKASDALAWACCFRGHRSRCTLVELENMVHFNRVLDVIAKIPQLDTDVAREKIMKQMHTDSADWVIRSQKILKNWKRPPSLARKQVVQNALAACSDIVQQVGAELIVLNTKAEDQLALHGLVYPFMVHFRHTPLLLR